MRRTKTLIALLSPLIAFFGLTVEAQTVAFPGALGYGAYATGGRNGTVYHVTSLADSGPGSFRTGVSSGNRVIVFDVGGHITLASAVSVPNSITIAGQTAPGGICFDAGEISFANRNNIICRFIRVRPGSGTASTGDDCISLYNAQNAIFDHVSMEYGPWNNLDAVSANWQVTPVTSITFQHCIDANPIGQQFGAHTECPSANWTWCYNIFANSHNRNPLAKVNTTFINNVEYNNSAGYTTHTSTKFSHDIVNNYFIAGPAYGGSSDFPWFQVDKNQSIYYSGNLFDGNDNGTPDGSTTTPYWYQGPGTILGSPWSPWTTVIPTVSAPLALRYDLSTAGAMPRDDVDSLVISQVKTYGSGTTGTGTGTTGPGTSLYTSQAQNGLANNGYGSIIGGVAPANSSGDGIADYWKLASNLNTNIAYPLTNTADGYTLLEHYLNFLAAPHAVTQTNTPVDINLAQFTSGFSPSTTFSLTNATNGAVTLVGGTTAHFVPNANFSGLGSFSFSINDSGLALSASVTVCVTPIPPPASATTFNGTLVQVATNSAASFVTPPANLTWHGDGTANVWNTSVSNWLNNASASAFKNSDIVTFDDTGSASPAITLTATVLPGGILFNDNQNYTLAGNNALSGSGSLSKTGTGTLLINTTNSGFSGAISLNGGMLLLVSGASYGSGIISLAGGGVFGVLGGGVGSVVNGNISVAARDSATLYSGQLATTFGGALSCPDTTSLLTLSNGVSFSGTSSSQFDGFLGTVSIPSGSTLRFSANSSKNTYGSLNPNFIINGTIQPRNSTNTIVLGALNGSGLLTGPQSGNTGTGATIYNIGGKNQDAVFNGNISSNTADPGSLICLLKVGTGTQTLNGYNTFTGTNAVLAGTLLVNGTNQPQLTTVFANATLGGTGVINGPVTVNTGGILSPGMNSAGTLTINGNLTNTTPTLNYTLSSSPAGANDRINLTGTLALNGVQTFNFNLANNVLGAGTYDLIEGANNSVQTGASFASNLPGNTRQNISFSAASPGSNPSYVRLVVAGSATSLLWSGTNGSSWDTSTVNWLDGGNADQYYNLDAVTFDDTSTNGIVSLAANVQPESLLVNNNSLPYTFGGPGALAGSGPLTKMGSGTLTINTTNSSFTGNIVLAAGTLALGSSTSIGSGNLTISSGATFSLPPGGNSVTVNRAITVPASQSANITSGVLSSTLGGAFISGNSSSVLNLSGAVSFGGTDSSQLDNFTGTVDLLPGSTVRFSANSGNNTYGSFNPTLVIDGLLQPRNAGNTIQLGAFTGSGTLAGPQSSTGTGDTLYVIGGNNTSANFNGVISSNSAVVNSDVSVNKIGNGTLTLSGASTYAGGTTVSAGTLVINNTFGSATGSGDLEVFSGAILTGNGSIASATTVDSGATLAPGNPGGTLTISNNLTLSDSSLLQFGLGTNSDLVSVSGDLALTGQLTVTNTGGFGPGSYTLFTCGGALNFGNLQLVLAPPGYNYGFDTNTPGVVKLTVAPATLPVIGISNPGDGQMIFSGTGGPPNATFYVLASTNLAAPPSGWQRVLTNQFDSYGNFAVTNNPGTNAQTFYRLHMPDNAQP